jgi:site-specific DNA-methyltransferase (adenine-specific)
MKPLSEKTYVEQALKNRKGITWLDDCRIPHQEKTKFTERQEQKTLYQGGWDYSKNVLASPCPEGRFPANLLVCDDILNDGMIHTSGHMDSIARADPTNQNVYGKMYPRRVYSEGDIGSFSRYFDLDRWFEKTFEYLPENVKRTFPFLICPKADKSERDKGLELKISDEKGGKYHFRDSEGFERFDTKVRNIHPTVKPIKLMSYLVTLGSRKGDIILDPFMGSGTTAIACKLLGRSCLGIEIEPLYCRIAEARLRNNREIL